MRLYRVVLLCLALFPPAAWGEAIVCGVTATPDQLSRFVPSVDPKRFKAGSKETCAAIIGEAATAEQIALSQAVPGRHIKVGVNITVAGQVQPLAMLEMTAAEKQAVDDALAAQAATSQAWYQETQTPGVCKYATEADVDAKMQQAAQNITADIDSMSLSASDKTKLKQAFQRVVTGLAQTTKCDVARASGG